MSSSAIAAALRKDFYGLLDATIPLPPPAPFYEKECQEYDFDALATRYLNLDQTEPVSTTSVVQPANGFTFQLPGRPSFVPHPSPQPRVVIPQRVVATPSRPILSFPSLWQPDYTLTAPTLHDGHSDVVREFIDRFYPDLPHTQVGADMISPNDSELETCPVLGCSGPVDMAIHSVRAHVTMHHSRPEHWCSCGQLIGGGPEALVYHITGYHFYNEYVKCRSCRCIRKTKDFLYHLEICPELAAYKVRGRPTQADCAENSMGSKRVAEPEVKEQDVTSPTKKRCTAKALKTARGKIDPKGMVQAKELDEKEKPSHPRRSIRVSRSKKTMRAH
ncbi:hypothetical protein BDP27DRAFT_1398878 [Rhodocollybia butyracea]|uniref:Uncharacterized protein n=1 Tax=Rhodocollybia butyracea TaxID=206335 RepID=A0A9P5Q4X0_9AGAR|nr:hypothetical protein BDP27DRAFT_1398878 [Rhodocollybia butyracea]